MSKTKRSTLMRRAAKVLIEYAGSLAAGCRLADGSWKKEIYRHEFDYLTRIAGDLRREAKLMDEEGRK